MENIDKDQFSLTFLLSKNLAEGRWVSASNRYTRETGESILRLFESYSIYRKPLPISSPSDPPITLKLLQAMERVLELAEEIFAGSPPQDVSSKLFKDSIFCKVHQDILNIPCPKFKLMHTRMSHLIEILRRGGLLGLSAERFLQACWESPMLANEVGWYRNFLTIGDMRPCSAYTGAFIGRNPMLPFWILEQADWFMFCLDAWYASNDFIENPRDAKNKFSVEAFRVPNRRKVEIFLSTQSFFFGNEVYKIFLRAPWIRLMLDVEDPLEPFSEELKSNVQKELSRWDMFVGVDDGLENVPSWTIESMLFAFTGKSISKTSDFVRPPYRALFPNDRDQLMDFDQCSALSAFLHELGRLSKIPPPPDPLSMIQREDAHP